MTGFTSIEEQGRYESAVYDNPRRSGEPLFVYLHRICLAVGSIDGDGTPVKVMPQATKALPAAPLEQESAPEPEPEQPAQWLPYRDP